MAVPLFGPKARFFDSNGDPLNGGLVYTYTAGTTTPKDSYTTEAGSVANANPVVLDSAGYADIWLGQGTYKIVLKTSGGTTIFTTDSYPGDGSTGFGGQVYPLSSNTSIDSTYDQSYIVATGTINLALLAAATATEGFIFTVQNNGSGVITIDPNGAETVNGSTTLTLQAGESATVVCDGSNWFAATSNVLFLDTQFRIVDNGDATKKIAFEASGITTGTTRTLTAQDVSGTIYVSGGTDIPVTDGGTGASTAPLAFGNIVAPYVVDKVLYGLTMANGTDATNDIDIAAGSCVSSDGTTLMVLSAITKQLDAAWAVGTAAGGLDTGAIANTTYHVWVIHRPDTGVTDVLFSTSASAPTMPTNYTKKKCIGSIVRAGGTILAFHQYGSDFILDTPVLDHTTGATAGTSAITATLASLPTGVKVKAYINAFMPDNDNRLYLSSLDSADLAPSTSVAPLSTVGAGATTNTSAQVWVWTNTSAQIRTRQGTSSAGGYKIASLGWRDTRI